MSKETRVVDYWHGTRAVLEPGTRLLPAQALQSREIQVPTADQDLYDANLVYMTTDRDYARAWVARGGQGVLLRVEPVGDLLPDPDTGSVGWAASSAIVLDVEEAPVTMSRMEIRRAFAKIQPERYDDAGYMIPAGDYLSNFVDDYGLTAAECRRFGRWANPHRVVYRPGSGIGYETDDVELVRGRLYRGLLDDGVDAAEALEAVSSSDVTIRLRDELARRPEPWL